MPDLDVVLVMGAMVWTVMSLLKLLSGKLYHDALTLLTAVAAGIGVAFLARATGEVFQDFNNAKVVFAGFAATATIRIPYEGLKAIDQHVSVKEPKLFRAFRGRGD